MSNTDVARRLASAHRRFVETQSAEPIKSLIRAQRLEDGDNAEPVAPENLERLEGERLIFRSYDSQNVNRV